MSFEIKICGVKNLEVALGTIAVGATHIGFNFFRKSPRYIAPEDAKIIADKIRGTIKIVAVTVDPDQNLLNEIKKLSPDYIQLHGRESVEDAKKIKKDFGFKIIKAISVSEKDDLKKAEEFSDIADYILFDAKPPKGSVLPGGNAVSFDWEILKDFSLNYKWILSGGLTPQNVNVAISASGAGFVDVSSGVESSLGVKDISLIERFIKAAKNT